MYYSLSDSGLLMLVVFPVLLFGLVMVAYEEYKRDERIVTDRGYGKPRFEYINIVITILIGLLVLLISVIKIDSNDRKIVKSFHYDYIEKINRGEYKYRLTIKKSDHLGIDYIETFGAGILGNKLKGVKNSPKGNLYQLECSYSEHWLGWWKEYDKECVEYIHRK